jgi:hypothetical protein
MNPDIIEYLTKSKTIITDRIVAQPFYHELAAMQQHTHFDNLIEFCYFLKTNETGICNYPKCSKKTKFISFKQGYRVGCCEDHTKRLNNLEKYGVENVMQLPEFKNNFKTSMLEKYGVTSSLKNPELLKKMHNTMHNQGGIGAVNPTIKTNMIKTNQQKYGVDNVMQNPATRHKFNTTMLQKYGVKNALENNSINQKRIDTTIARFGSPHHTQSLKYKTQCRQKFITKKIQKLQAYVKPVFSCDDYVDVDQDLQWQCVVCDSTFTDNLDNGKIPRCLECNPLLQMGYSKMEQQLATRLSCFFQVELNNRTVLSGKELDIYIPSKKIAIEFNGIYWHSELFGKNKNYHLNKTKQCAQQGIQLIHVFETEWLKNQQLVTSVILSKLGVFDNRIYARQCVIREITSNEKNVFLEKNHMQGNDKSSVKLGLFHSDELVAVMTFGKSRYNKNYQYEMHRFCNKIGYQIIGGASKLWSYFVKHQTPNSVITYADRRYSEGALYAKLGFSKTDVSPPNYFYFKNNNVLLSRLQFQKQKLQKILPRFDADLTEWENMQLHGYNRIWDCGNHVFVWKNHQTHSNHCG